MNLRKKIPLNEFLKREGMQRRDQDVNQNPSKRKDLAGDERDKLKKILRSTEGSGKAVLLDESLKVIREISARGFGGSLRRMNERPYAIVLDGTVTGSIIESAEDAGCQVLVAKNFAATSNNIQLLSF